MMKKTYKSSLLALSVLASFTSCSESESLQQANLSKDKITFHATLDNSWKPLSPASSSRAAIAAATEKGPIVVSTPFGKPLYLHPVVQDGIHIWSKEGKPITRSGAPLEDVEHERVAQTRGTMSTKTDLSDYDSFGVTAIYKNGENNVSLFQEENGDPKIAVATSTTEDKVWEIKDSRWPVGSEVSFHAFAPYSGAGSTSPLSFKPDVDGEKTLITYTALTGTEEIKAQPDLILATAKGSQSDNALGLNFSHALTAVTFAIDKDLAEVLGAGKKLTSITLSGIPNEGTYDLAVMKGDGTAAPEWQFAQDGGSNKTGKYTFDLKDQDIVTGKDFALTSDNNTLMMIPQTLPETAKLNFQFELDGVLQSLIIDMKDQVWQPGKSVIYKLSASAINSLTNTEVVYPSTWNAVGYPKQDFAKDEAIGLFAVSQDKRITAKNVKLVKQIEDGNEIWKSSDGNKFLRTANYKYFAYYPYDANLSETDLDVNAETADAFFAKKITNWNPAENQNTEDILLKQDLQVAKGVVEADASTLTFNMTHSMGLAVLNLNAKEVPEKRTFTTDNYTYYYPELEGRATTEPAASEYTDATAKQSVEASTEFNGNIPFLTQTTDKRYVQIVKPNMAAVFKAQDETNKPRTAWGTLKPYSFNVDKNQVKTQNITSDADYYYLARHFQMVEKYEEFIAPVDGEYLLQCWGASGTNYNYSTEYGKGGYADGKYSMTTLQTLYVCVGGRGNKYNNYQAVGHSTIGAPGGGATSITTSLIKSGELRHYVDSKDEVLLVAGGGGGGEWHGLPGAGGGEKGKDGVQSSSPSYGTGGTQKGPGTYVGGWQPQNWYPAGFGYGGYGCGSYSGKWDVGAQGGGGWYGGGGSTVAGPAGGGSGYVRKAVLKDASRPLLYDYHLVAGDEKPFYAPDGKAENGHDGDGDCLITLIEFKQQ